MLLPVFVAVLGARDAVAVLTVAQLAGNGSRVWFNRAEVDRRLVGIFAVGAVPAATAGALLFSMAPLPALTRVIGVFLLAMVVWGRQRPRAARLDDRAFAAVGAASGSARHRSVQWARWSPRSSSPVGLCAVRTSALKLPPRC
ncbi:sulfite exporter TauE/SafE family protein [Streptomyces sp. NPDC006290]|uniref:sulfite exporter TauE/SafE family protein n=1 Tax=Streptomyces sp. NPDC006290 TaxID=3156745 RepID=UPI0033BB40FC